MKARSYALIGALMTLPATAALGQTAGISNSPTMVVGSGDTSTLRAGTPVSLRMMETLSTKGKKLREGTRFNLETAEPVTLNGMTVIPVGSPAIGEVIDVKNKGMWGKSGRINVRVLYVRANGRQIRLTGVADDKGTAGTVAVVGAAVFVPVVGFFVTGTSATIPTGAAVSAFLDEDIPVAFAPGAAPAPMMVAPAASYRSTQMRFWHHLPAPGDRREIGHLRSQPIARMVASIQCRVAVGRLPRFSWVEIVGSAGSRGDACRTAPAELGREVRSR